MILRRDIEHLHRFHDLFGVNGFGDQSVDELCVLRNAHVLFDCRKVLICHRPDHRGRFLIALRKVEHFDCFSVFVKEPDCFAAERNGKAGFFPLRRGCDKGCIGLLREKLQRDRCRVLEHAPLEPQEIGQKARIF